METLQAQILRQMIINVFIDPCHRILKFLNFKNQVLLNPLQNVQQSKHKEIGISDTDNKNNREEKKADIQISMTIGKREDGNENTCNDHCN